MYVGQKHRKTTVLYNLLVLKKRWNVFTFFSKISLWAALTDWALSRSMYSMMIMIMTITAI